MNYELAVKNIRQNLKEYIENARLESLVLGISGGIDSTLCAILAKPVCDELDIPLIGRFISIESNVWGETERAISIGEKFCTTFLNIDVTSTYNHMKFVIDLEKETKAVKELNKDEVAEKIRHGNAKARIRMIMLYNFASMYNGMVLSTDNWTEYLLGFWTLHGDVGDYGMIQELWKTEVYEMAEWIARHEINGNEKILSDEALAVLKVIEADATDGLGITKTDLDQILPSWKGSSRDGYAEVDKNLQGFNMLLKDAAKTPNVIKAMRRLSDKPPVQRQIRTEFKRQNPFNIPRKNITNEK